MELVPWRPFGELSSFRDEMDKLWNRTFGERPFAGTLTEEWLPSVDISETKDSYIVKAELPGLEAKDVNVNLSGDLLTIKGEKKSEKEDKGEEEGRQYHRIERSSGMFQRSITMPFDIETDAVNAEVQNGVLTVILAKPPEMLEKTKKIEVKQAS